MGANKRNIVLDEEWAEIDKIMDKIWKEFGVEVAVLSRPTTIEEAKRLYNRILENELMRNIKIF